MYFSSKSTIITSGAWLDSNERTCNKKDKHG